MSFQQVKQKVKEWLFPSEELKRLRGENEILEDVIAEKECELCSLIECMDAKCDTHRMEKNANTMLIIALLFHSGGDVRLSQELVDMASDSELSIRVFQQDEGGILVAIYSGDGDECDL